LFPGTTVLGSPEWHHGGTESPGRHQMIPEPQGILLAEAAALRRLAAFAGGHFQADLGMVVVEVDSPLGFPAEQVAGGARELLDPLQVLLPRFTADHVATPGAQHPDAGEQRGLLHPAQERRVQGLVVSVGGDSDEDVWVAVQQEGGGPDGVRTADFGWIDEDAVILHFARRRIQPQVAQRSQPDPQRDSRPKSMAEPRKI